MKSVAQRELGGDARVILFGSRTDDAKRGGDIDLLFETPHLVGNRATALGQIYSSLICELGDRKIDVLLSDPDTPDAPVLRVARETGVVL
ncbi:MAG: nucleotidyltransferase domain-containing protein [Betaproteobacteria bacterium]